MIDRISVTIPTSIRCQRERGSYLPPNWFVADRIAIQTQYLIPLLTLQLGLIVWQRWPVKCKHEYSNYPASFLKTELHSFFFLTFLHLIALCRCNSWSFRSHSESWRQSYSLHIVRCQLYLNKRNNWLLKWERKKKKPQLRKMSEQLLEETEVLIPSASGDVKPELLISRIHLQEEKYTSILLT